VWDREEDCKPLACKPQSTVSVMTNDLEAGRSHYVDALPYGQEAQRPWRPHPTGKRSQCMGLPQTSCWVLPQNPTPKVMKNVN